MPTPKAGYFLKDGTKVPGTTTVIGRFKDSGGLMHWAFKQGQSGKATLYEERDKAADIGTCAHAMVEAFINDGDADLDEILRTLPENDRAKAWSAFNAYRAWAKNFKVKIVEQEIMLVSEEYKYGGTLDAVGYVGKALCLLDWKTSSAVRTDYLVQLAAYDNLWKENRPDKPITGGFHLLRFSKEFGDFAHHFYPNLDIAWRQFVLFREAYQNDKELKSRAA